MATVDDIYNEGDKLRGEGRLEEAVEKFKEGLAVDEKHALTHLALALTYVKLNQCDQAVEHGQRACELDPHDPLTFTTMSVAYQRAWAATNDMKFIQLAEEARDRANALAQGH